MKNILLVNDDGPFSEGVEKLKERFENNGFSVFVFVPHQEMSACSHSLTLTKPLHVKEIKKNYFIVDGTPSDCTYLALFHFLKEIKIDYVVSGVNRGYNMGEDVFYSGTVAGAMEGFFHGINGIAVSAKDFSNIDKIVTHFVDFFKKLIDDKLPSPFLLNINYPEGDIKGIKFTSLSSRLYPGNVEECVDPRGVTSYWIGGVPAVWNGEENSDINAVKQGYVSITPLKADITDDSLLEKLR
ncbi:5'-nucleotidase [Thermotomaculum hydrothermale]|uniref:5'-nucleotidase SurE n=1 Tax=Thermotomaculum hydrothermale TaxID=981385 RepID=A0A7R6PLF9_9BACT|nr:5'/3'-nucleotidase SurE [Thermotomaculum hydrothermale]BBB31748.1 5'-nucleotidase [Thermotomaculum hydrothermale]